MKAHINSGELIDALSKVLSILEKKSPIRPMISYAFFELPDNSIEIRATDMEVAAKMALGAEIEGQGRFCINAKKLFDAPQRPSGQICQH